MLTSLLEPTTGQVLLDGVPVNLDLLAYKARIGYVPEEAHLYTYLTGPEYLELVGQLRGLATRVLRDKIDAFLQVFGLEDDRYATMAAYSTGMRQKILVSAALLHDPEIVVSSSRGCWRWWARSRCCAFKLDEAGVPLWIETASAGCASKQRPSSSAPRRTRMRQSTSDRPIASLRRRTPSEREE